MPKFIVLRREVWVQAVEIKAKDPEQAIRLVADGDGDTQEYGPEYSHALPSKDWTVQDENGEIVLD